MKIDGSIATLGLYGKVGRRREVKLSVSESTQLKAVLVSLFL